jgi:alpha-1,6-mannosyltransferase
VWAYRWFDRFASRERIDRCFEWLWDYVRRTSAGFDLVVCAAPSLAQRLTAGGVRGSVTLPMGVDAGVFSPDLRDPSLRAGLLARCGLPESAFLLLGVGRHTPEKRWPTVIDAVTSVGAQRPLGLVLVGDGHQQARVLAHIGGDPHVQALEPIRDRRLLARVMASADALVHGSSAETFGLVAAEALASGLPLVVPAGGAVADLARPAFAETYAPGDPRAAAAAIERMMDRDRPALRAAARAAAGRARTLDQHFAELFDAYAAALTSDRAAA